MNQKDYRKAFDQISYSEDFQKRTKALLQARARELEKERNTMKFASWKKKLAVAAAVAAALAVSVSAAVLFLSPSDVARRSDQPALAAAFESPDAKTVNETKRVGDYSVTLEGLVSGKGLRQCASDVAQDRTYVVLAVARTDGAPQTEMPEGLAFTPLVDGYNIMAVNAWTLGGGYSSFSENGVWYYLFDTQTIDIFADHTVHFAVYEGLSPDAATFKMDENGVITLREGAKGAMFTLPLDVTKADPAAAKAFAESTGMPVEPMTDAQREAAEADQPAVTAQEDEPGRIVIRPADGEDLELFTADEFAKYVEDEKVGLQMQLDAGVLSQATYDQSVADLEADLAGVRDGSLMAYRMENGYATAAVIAPDSDHTVSYANTGDGIMATIR